MPTGKRNVRIAQTAGEDISCRLLAVGEFMLSWPLHRETSAEIPDGVTRRRRTGEEPEKNRRGTGEALEKGTEKRNGTGMVFDRRARESGEGI